MKRKARLIMIFVYQVLKKYAKGVAIKFAAIVSAQLIKNHLIKMALQ